MTRKHYEAIAGIIRQIYDAYNNGPKMMLISTDVLDDLAGDLANYFASNKKFNRDKFMKACFGGE